MHMRGVRVWLAVLLVLGLGLAACGGDDGDTASGDSTEDSGGTETASEDESDGGDEPDGGEEPSGEPIKIGLVWPQTGPVARTGEQVRNAAQLAIDEVNGSGGIDGRPLEMLVYDTESNPEKAAQETQRAISEDGVVAIVGPHSTSEALAMVDISEREQVPTLGNSAATPAITEGKEFTFRVQSVTPDIAAGLVELAQDQGAETAVLLYDSGGFGLASGPLVEESAEAAGLELVEVIEYPLDGTDYSAEVATILRADPDVVLISGSSGADHGLFAKQMVEQGLTVPFLGFSPISFEDAVTVQAGAYDQLEGVYTLQTVDTQKPQYKEFHEAYNANFDEEEVLPEMVPQTYDAIMLLADALKASGGEGGQALADALRDLEPREGVGGRAGAMQDFSEGDHDVYTQGEYLVPYRFEGGQLVQAN